MPVDLNSLDFRVLSELFEEGEEYVADQGGEGEEGGKGNGGGGEANGCLGTSEIPTALNFARWSLRG